MWSDAPPAVSFVSCARVGRPSHNWALLFSQELAAGQAPWMAFTKLMPALEPLFVREVGDSAAVLDALTGDDFSPKAQVVLPQRRRRKPIREVIDRQLF